jgi:hypothetical protein
MSDIQKRLFDYGSITEEHKKVIEEVIYLYKESKIENFDEFLKSKFQVELPPRFPIQDSLFVKFCKEHQFRCAIMGYAVDDEGVEYPVISITEDVRKLDNFVKDIMTTAIANYKSISNNNDSRAA